MKKYSVKSFLCGFMAATIIGGSLSSLAYAEPFKKQLNAVYNDIKLVVNGIAVTPRDSSGNVVDPFIVAGTTYLPVRAVAEALGEEVDWDGQTNTVYIGERYKDEKKYIPTKEGNLGIVDFIKDRPPYSGNMNKFYIGHTINDIDYTERPYIEVRQKKYDVQNVLYFTDIHDQYGETLTFLLDGEFKKLTAKFATDDYSDPQNSGYVQIYSDNELTFNTLNYRGEEIINIEFDLIGVDELQIYVARNRSGGRTAQGYFKNNYSYLFDVEFEPLNK